MSIPKNAFTNEQEALKVKSEIERNKFGIVEKVIKRKKVEKPPKLHSLTSLQREANKLYGFPAQKTLSIAQKLYEERKVISYPRTDSQYLAESNKPLVVQILKALGKEDLIPQVEKVGKRVFNDARLTDHHAIIPLKPPTRDLTPEERKIYNLIWRKFVGAFMEDYIYETTSVIIRVGKYKFGTRGKVDIALGWKALYKEEKQENSKLPLLKEGDKVLLKKVEVKKQFTQPPPRYSEGKLLKVMEKLGLGTPATRAQIIETLKKRGYIAVKGKNIVVSEKAKELIEKLKDLEVSSPEMTARWENALENIHLKKVGYKGYQHFLDKVKEFTAKQVERLKGETFEVSEGFKNFQTSKKTKRKFKKASKGRFKKFKKN